MSLTLYGIPACDTMRKARAWLDARGVVYAFHDYKKAGVPEAALRGWVAALGWAAVLNRNGQTFRKLPEAEKTDLDEQKAVALMLANPSAIRRPVLVAGDRVQAGFDAAAYAALLDLPQG